MRARRRHNLRDEPEPPPIRTASGRHGVVVPYFADLWVPPEEGRRCYVVVLAIEHGGVRTDHETAVT